MREQLIADLRSSERKVYMCDAKQAERASAVVLAVRQIGQELSAALEAVDTSVDKSEPARLCAFLKNFYPRSADELSPFAHWCDPSPRSGSTEVDAIHRAAHEWALLIQTWVIGARCYGGTEFPGDEQAILARGRGDVGWGLLSYPARCHGLGIVRYP